MPPALKTTKFAFRIRTRHGLLVEHLMIHGRDETDAERKLRQMYPHCEILERGVVQPATPKAARATPAGQDCAIRFEEVASLIGK
jgi:hypothetical protein